ncbi:hypothetical protein PUN28_011857 [Cardiocondyla obscurior]|uniref:Ribosomal protein S17 n=1 Tax=Cardiocondyla obscurior TaxID=286306 RepID=A0AAW2FHA0_9HYME
MEKIFRAFIKNCRSKNKRDFFVSKCQNIFFYVPPCHKLKSYIIKRFITFRLKINSKNCGTRVKHYRSKTMAMHNLE